MAKKGKTEGEKQPPSEIGEFIKTTLASVFHAIDDANYTDMAEGPFRIFVGTGGGGKGKPIGQKYTFEMPATITFDIAVTATDSSTVNGGIDLKIAKIGSDVAGAQSKVSRVSFEIPITKNFGDD